MEDTSAQKSERRNPLTYVIVASFLLGSFSGAAFGVLFAVSLNQKYYPWRETADPAAAVARQPVSAEDRRVIDAVREVSPAVVSVVVKKDLSKLYETTGPLGYFGFEIPQAPTVPGQKQEIGGGTGFVISEDGLILTNRHVAADTEADYEVVFSDGTILPATVLARDSILDIAVLKVQATGLTVAPLGDSDVLSPGETVIAIGNSLSEYRNSVTKGVISAINRRVIAGNGSGESEVLEEALQTDAAINPGNSGGPLVDLEGKVIGVNTAINRSGQSIGFAIPINAVKIVIESVKVHGKIVRPWLGVRYSMLTAETAKRNGLEVGYGALLVGGTTQGDGAAIVHDSPADKAGLKAGDVLLDVDGVRLEIEHPLSTVIAKKRAGDVVQVRILRDGVERVIPVTLGVLPDAP
ncbi:MAG: trypsin-like peptidase domain-containing protein [Patescibacteria group bacterium]|jgi:S1-C subfamily serine protease